MGKQHSDPAPAASPARGTFQVPPVCQPRASPGSGVSVLQQLCEGRDGGTRRLSILQASADTQGRLIHCPISPPIPAWKCLSCKSVCLFARAGQEGCTLRSGKVSTPCVGAQRSHTFQPCTMSSTQSHHSLPPKNHPGPRPGCSPAEGRLRDLRE